MTWKVTSTVEQRLAFCEAAGRPGSNMAALCREYGISRKTGYKWRKRVSAAAAQGVVAAQAVQTQSRRPHSCPQQTGAVMEAAVLALRRAQPAWGGRKLHNLLLQRGQALAAGLRVPELQALPVDPALPVPAASTITALLARNGYLDPVECRKHKPTVRFAMEQPNELWQMDFKGDFVLGDGVRCYPLTVLDDHSRFLLRLAACSDQRLATVQTHLTQAFMAYGLPERMLVDNGSPWGCDPTRGRTHPYHTAFSVWLLHYDVLVCHGRVRHPQTQGKDERLHRSLKAEMLAQAPPASLASCQAACDAWRNTYNTIRPHEALGDDPPSLHYRRSQRTLPACLPTLTYDAGISVRKVAVGGRFSFKNREWPLGKPFIGYTVGLQPTAKDGCYSVLFGKHAVATIDLKDPLRRIQCVTYVPEHV